MVTTIKQLTLLSSISLLALLPVTSDAAVQTKAVIEFAKKNRADGYYSYDYLIMIPQVSQKLIMSHVYPEKLEQKGNYGSYEVGSTSTAPKSFHAHTNGTNPQISGTSFQDMSTTIQTSMINKRNKKIAADIKAQIEQDRKTRRIVFNTPSL